MDPFGNTSDLTDPEVVVRISQLGGNLSVECFFF